MSPLPDSDAWNTFTQLGVVIIFLATVFGAVWRIRKPKCGPRQDTSATAAPAGRQTVQSPQLEERVATLERALKQNYITRDDWVPIASRMMGMMERQTEMLARLDERTRQQ